MFQFLIGRLKTYTLNWLPNYTDLFQFLIGRLKTRLKCAFFTQCGPEKGGATGYENRESLEKAKKNEFYVCRRSPGFFTSPEVDNNFILFGRSNSRSEERRVGKECRSRWSTYN